MIRPSRALASSGLELQPEGDALLKEKRLPPGGSAGESDPIQDDRGLLRELGMSDADAAALLGRSRQALHQKLGKKSGGGGNGNGNGGAAAGSSDYFKVSDIFTLTSAARQLGREFRSDAVLKYTERTRKKREPEAFALLNDLLNDEPQPFDVSGASAILMILPGFADMLVRFDKVGDFLVDIVEAAQDKSNPAEVFVVGPTSMQADIAGDWLGVPEDRCFGSDSADYFLPTLIVFAADEQRVYTLSEKGEFVGAPLFQRAVFARNALAMLPADMRTLASARRSPRSRRRG